MKILMRADGGKGIGLGHIMRMCVLAQAVLENDRNEIVFICKYSSCGKYDAGINIIKDNKFKVLTINEDSYIEDIIKIQKTYEADMLITDSYNVDADYFNVLKLYFKITGYIDDVNNKKMNVDIIVNQNINAFNLNYKKNILPNTKLLLGTNYCMLRKEFREACKNKKNNCEVSNILLTLGGMDDNYNTLKILKQIKDCGKNIHVVIGNAFDDDLVKRLNKIEKENNNVYIYENAIMSEIMLKCDIAIAGCGSTLYELSAMKVPAIGVVIADNQKETAIEMKRRGIIYEIHYSDSHNFQNMKQSVENLIKNNEMRDNIIKKQSQCVNVNGVYNIVEKIEDMYRNYERKIL